VGGQVPREGDELTTQQRKGALQDVVRAAEKHDPRKRNSFEGEEDRTVKGPD